MQPKTILITGIGGNVGQGIARNIRATAWPIRIVGTNITKVSSGNYLCDVAYKVPFGYNSNYIPSIVRIVQRENVDLIIPSTDYESVYLAAARKALPNLATSDVSINRIFLDKYETFLQCKKYGISFAASMLPSSYSGQFKAIIVKPREGRGSKGVCINPQDWSKYQDDFVVQEYLKGIELTSSFYVSKSGAIIGNITFARELYSGFTSRCSVTFNYNKQIQLIIQKLCNAFQIRGSFNIQAIVNKYGKVTPFEFNSRISGTNSIRAFFGFPDVRWTVEEYAYNLKPNPEIVKKGCAIRVLADIIYPDMTYLSQVKDKNTRHIVSV